MWILKNFLNERALEAVESWVDKIEWEDGADTAHGAAKAVKSNKQATKPTTPLVSIRKIIEMLIRTDPRVENVAMPVAVTPAFVNKHEPGDAYGVHVDRASRLRLPDHKRTRCDLSMTIFLSDPAAYEGGELVVYSGHSSQKIKLERGDAVIYAAGHKHEVKPVVSGTRKAICLWMQSAIRDSEKRRLLAELTQAINAAAVHGLPAEAQTSLSMVKQNLHRLWIES